MKKLIMVFILSLIFVTSLYAKSIWEYKEDEDIDGMTKSLTSWTNLIISETDVSAMMQFSKIYGIDLIIFGSTEKSNKTHSVRFKFDNNPIEIFEVEDLVKGYNFRLKYKDVNRFLSKLKNTKRIMFELNIKDYGKICPKFYTDGLNLKKIDMK
jgi:hypothetical protein